MDLDGTPGSERVNRNRGKASGAVTETPLAFVTEIRNGKTVSIRAFLDHKKALEAAGLEE